jgi:hypothetical protein
MLSDNIPEDLSMRSSCRVHCDREMNADKDARVMPSSYTRSVSNPGRVRLRNNPDRSKEE